jgi:YD repeat-containing protein
MEHKQILISEQVVSISSTDEVTCIVSEASSTDDTVTTTYDTVGRVATVNNSGGTTTRELSYDASLRLTQEVFYDSVGTAQETIT